MTTSMPASEEYKLVRRAFGCGVDVPEFKQSFEKISIRDRARLGRVARRMLVAGALRYRLRDRPNINHPAETVVLHNVLFHMAELPSLEIFYLFGCLDTLATGGHVDFAQWLKRADTRERLSLADRALTVDEIIAVHKQYQDEQGVGANLRRLFEALPPAVAVWLVDNVRVVPAGEEIQSLDEVQQEPSHIVLHLYHYFYRTRRNPFAHESEAPITDIARDVKRGEGWHVLVRPVSWGNKPSDFWTHRVEGQDWMTYLRNGVDEATVLRMIVYGAALQSLGIDATTARVDAYFTGLSRQPALYGFLDEIQHNALALSWWATYDESGAGELHTFVERYAIPQMEGDWAQRLIDRYLDNPLEQGLQELTQEYLQAVTQLNRRIAEFDAQYPPSTRGGSERRQSLSEFIAGQMRSQAYSLVMQMPLQPAVEEHIWHAADDPCYT